MKYAIAMLAAASLVTLAACDRPATTSSTTVVKEPVVQKEKETSTTIVQAPEQQPAPQSNVTIETKPEATTERSRTTSTTRVDTPLGTATKTETETSKTTR